ncbi:hypothetical protein [Pseudomonas bharatica]|uniref:hypothetical protein n=1 Tax=Pseudomonas bharatica TaxID=2692112 RepID=UPI003B28B3BE
MLLPFALQSSDKSKPVFKLKKDGVEYPYFIADSALAKRLSGLTQVMDDLNHAHELMAMIKDIESAEIAYSLWMSAIVTYGKCFATARGRRIKIEEKHVRAVGEEAVEFHRSILSMRNEYFAHAGENEYEKSSTVVVLQPESLGKSVVAVNHFNVKHSKPSEDFCIYFCYLCRKLHDVIRNIGEGVHELVLAEYQAMNVDELYARIEK